MINNQVILIGNLGKDAEILYSNKTKNEFVALSLAVSESYYDAEAGEYKTTEPTWIDAVVFKGLALAKSRFLSKGQKVLVQGELTNLTQEIHEKKYTFTKLNVKQIEVIGSKEMLHLEDAA